MEKIKLVLYSIIYLSLVLSNILSAKRTDMDNKNITEIISVLNVSFKKKDTKKIRPYLSKNFMATNMPAPASFTTGIRMMMDQLPPDGEFKFESKSKTASGGYKLNIYYAPYDILFKMLLNENLKIKSISIDRESKLMDAHNQLNHVMLNTKKYEPNWESLNSRPTPHWFKEAKFGIFIHWGLYSVPAWSPKGSYAEWYLNGLLNNDTARIRYHKENYGEDFQYRDFIDDFTASNYNPDKWAELFKYAGAKYVVLTSKHHDGFCLWPSSESNGYNSFDGAAKRDLLGDLNNSVKKAGLKSGFYYSLYEWQHPDYPEYVEKYVDQYMLPQLKDAVQRYSPDIIFSDGEWDRDSREWRSEQFLAWLYNDSNAPEDIVVNDRWGGDTRFKHGGYFSTEYDPNSGALDERFIIRGWEECRGMGKSFGYNKNENREDYNTSEELIKLLVDIVCRGGNLLLNIGPKADGTIPKVMVERLMDIGIWLGKNGEAIYSTTINRISESAGMKFTLSKDRTALFVFIENIPEKELIIEGINAVASKKISFLGGYNNLKWRNEKNNLVIDIPENISNKLAASPVYVLKIPVLPYLDEPDIDLIINNDAGKVTIVSKGQNIEYLYGFGDKAQLSKEYTGSFIIEEATMLNIQASAEGHQPSGILSVPVNILKEKNGLHQRTYQGKWDNCSEMLEGKPIEQEIVYNFSIDLSLNDDFGHTFFGYIKIEEEGVYGFQTVSDDGSRLLINDVIVVDNDGLHSRTIVSNEIYLKSGMHEIQVDYFERGGQESLNVNWKGPGFDWREIPEFKLFHTID